MPDTTPTALALRLTRRHGTPTAALDVMGRDFRPLQSRLVDLTYPISSEQLFESLRLERRFVRRCDVERELHALEANWASPQVRERVRGAA
jgi:hypothetical protein